MSSHRPGGSRLARHVLVSVALGIFSFFAFTGMGDVWAEPDHSGLERAYRRELAVLGAEIAELASQGERQEQWWREHREALMDSVTALNARLVALRVQTDRLGGALRDMDLQVDMGDVGDETLDTVLEQAQESLRRHGIHPRTDGVPGTDQERRVKMESVFEAAQDLLGRQASIIREQGRFFDSGGREKRGTLLRLGMVATYAWSDEGEGGAWMLAPAPGGNLKVVETLPDYLALFVRRGGDFPPQVPVYLYDPQHVEETEDSQRGILQDVQAGGMLVWPILGLALVALLIVLERLRTLGRVHTNAERLMREVHLATRRGDWEGAARLCEQRPGSVSRVLNAALKSKHLERGLYEDAVSEAMLKETASLERFLPALHVIAAVAPLLGLLGTVTGMISTFEVITVHGTGDPKLLSGGISEALITTKLGLMVAIPVLLLHSYLTSRVDHIYEDMERNALILSNSLHREHCHLLKDGKCDCSPGEDSLCLSMNFTGEDEQAFCTHRIRSPLRKALGKAGEAKEERAAPRGEI